MQHQYRKHHPSRLIHPKLKREHCNPVLTTSWLMLHLLVATEDVNTRLPAHQFSPSTKKRPCLVGFFFLPISKWKMSASLRFSPTIVQEELIRWCNYLIEATSMLSVPNSLTITHSHYTWTVAAFICCKFTHGSSESCEVFTFP